MSLRKTIAPTLLPRRLGEIGKIKIGGRGPERTTAEGKTMHIPQKLDHFRVTRRDREDDGFQNFVLDEPVHAVVGEKPCELDCRLMFDSPEENFQSQLQHYKGRTKVWQCDGEEAVDLRKDETRRCVRANGGECPCKPYGRLLVVLEAAPAFGTGYVFRTTSWESINNIQTVLELLYEQFGFLAGLPMRLRVYPAEVQYQQGNQTKTSTAYKVALELRGTYDEAAQIARAAQERRLANATELKLLAAAREKELDELDTAEAEEIAEEFHPDPNQITSVKTAETIEEMKDKLGVGEASAEAEALSDADGRDTTSVPGPDSSAEGEPEDETEEDSTHTATSAGAPSDYEATEREAIQAESDEAPRPRPKPQNAAQRKAELFGQIQELSDQHGVDLSYAKAIAAERHGSAELMRLPVASLEDVYDRLGQQLLEEKIPS